MAIERVFLKKNIALTEGAAANPDSSHQLHC